MLDVVDRIDLDDVAFVVLEAGGRSWYPGRFWQPHVAHVPWLDWSIEACERAFEGLALDPGRVFVGGFSQGACIAAEWVAQRPRAYAGAAILTGSLMGTRLSERELPPLRGLRVVAATSELDDWVPFDLAEASARCFERAGASVELHASGEREHCVGDEAVAAVRGLLGSSPSAS